MIGRWPRAFGTLVPENIPEELVRALKLRAAQKAEEEHRDILRRALAAPKPSLKSMLAAIPGVGDEPDFEREQDLGRSVDI